MEALVEGYELALSIASDNTESPISAPDAVKFTMKRALGRKWKHLAEERIEDVRPKALRGEHFWALSKTEQKEIRALFETEDVRRLITLLKSRPNDAKVRVLDAAYWIKGCSSLGRLRYSVLARVREDGLVSLTSKRPSMPPRRGSRHQRRRATTPSGLSPVHAIFHRI